jgi:hypothetical protein
MTFLLVNSQCSRTQVSIPTENNDDNEGHIDDVSSNYTRGASNDNNNLHSNTDYHSVWPYSMKINSLYLKGTRLE